MPLGYIEEEYGLRKEALEFPMMCVMALSYVCNSCCPSCPYTHTKIRSTYKDRPFMDEDIFMTIADQCGEYGAWLRITGGGEPMSHPKAVELMEYAKKRKARIGLITNGSLFTEKSLRRLISAEVDMIEFSVDAGDRTTHEKVRPGLDWKKLLENVDIAIKIRNGIKSQTKIIASVINQKGVDIGRAKGFWCKIVDEVQIRKYLTWGYLKDLSADPVPYLEPKEKIPCPWLFERLNIDTRGDVTICGEDLAFKESFANVKDMPIKEIWHGYKFEYLRKKHLAREGHEIPICRNCPDWKYRSWTHNYWKVLKKAEEIRRKKVS